MNPKACRIALQPRDPLDVLDLVVLLLRRAAPAFASFGLVLLPLLLLMALISQLVWWAQGMPSLFAPEAARDGFTGLVAALLLGLPLAIVLRPAVALYTGRLLFEERPDRGRVLWALGRHGNRLLLLLLLHLLILVTSCFTLFLAVPVLQLPLAFAQEVVLLEQVGLRRVFQRSWTLSSRHPLNALVAVISLPVLLLWGALTAELAGQFLVAGILQLGQPLGSLAAGEPTPFLVLGAVGGAAVHAVYRVLLYVDTRTRIEGWDLQVRLRAAAGGA